MDDWKLEFTLRYWKEFPNSPWDATVLDLDAMPGYGYSPDEAIRDWLDKHPRMDDEEQAPEEPGGKEANP